MKTTHPLKIVLEQNCLHRRFRIQRFVDVDVLDSTKHDSYLNELVSDMRRELAAEIDRLQRKGDKP